MKVARVNMVTINVFSWALLEPAPDEYSFEQLDRIMDRLGADFAREMRANINATI